MAQSWEQYERSIDPEGGSATLNVSMKWSVWSADMGTWEEYAPDALAHMKSMYNNELVLNMSSRKEIRHGQVLITGSSESEDAPGELLASGYFCEEWDSADDICDTLGLEDGSLDAESLPYTMCGHVGVRHEFYSIAATSVEELLAKIDAEEDALIKESSELWNELEATYRGPRVGMGATIIAGSDMWATTITRVTKRTIVLQRDKVTRTDANGMSDNQRYDIEPDKAGATFRAYRNKWNTYYLSRAHGHFRVHVGGRWEKRDFGF